MNSLGVSTSTKNNMKKISSALIIAYYNGDDFNIEDMTYEAFKISSERDLFNVDDKKNEMQLLVFNCETYLYDIFRFEVKLNLIETNEWVKKYKVEVLNDRNIYKNVCDSVSKLSSLFLDRNISKNLEDFKDIREIYPVKEDMHFLEDFNKQKELWKSKVFEKIENDKFILEDGVELAFCISNDNMYNNFLNTAKIDRDNFFNKYLKNYGLDQHPIFLNNQISRLYIGNSFCPYQQPSNKTMLEMIRKAHNQGFHVTIDYPYLNEDCINKFEDLLQNVVEYCKENKIKIEIVINDWGVLNCIKDYNEYVEPILGKLLNKRKKDPRFRWKWLPKDTKDIFSTNNYNNDYVLKCINEEGIKRIEYESFGLENRLPYGKHSLHFPFYQMMTSTFCPLKYKISKFKKNIINANECRRYCDEIVGLYPQHLNMIGVGNSILGFDIKILQSDEHIKKYTSSGFNRFVVFLV